MIKIIHLFTKTDNRFSNIPLRFDRKNITSRGRLFIFAKFLDHIGLHSILEKNLSLDYTKGRETDEAADHKPALFSHPVHYSGVFQDVRD